MLLGSTLLTFTVQDAEYSLPFTVILAVIVVFPAATAVILPPLTVAILVSADFHVTAEPVGTTVALSVAVPPT